MPDDRSFLGRLPRVAALAAVTMVLVRSLCLSGLLVSPVWGAEPLAPNARFGSVTVANGKTIDIYRIGSNRLALPGDYLWWYGCAPTSAGMMLGYYDVNGYSSGDYSNLVPGGAAETETFPPSPPATGTSALVNQIIASSRHISDYYGGGYGASGDDMPGAPTGPLNCLADFMGTSQDSVGNFNGSTSFHFPTDESPAYIKDVYSWGQPSIDIDGMYGIFEYLQYAGYFTSELPRFSRKLYSQYISGYMGTNQGFTWQQYTAEVDAGRPVMIHIWDPLNQLGHAMVGVGYQDSGGQQLVELCDTWYLGHGAGSPSTMTWGGTYVGGSITYNHAAVTVLDLGATARGIAIVNHAGNWEVPLSSNNPDDTLYVMKLATDMGPFDMEMLVAGGLDPINILEEVQNLTTAAWTDYHIQLGTGVGANFTPSIQGDGLAFISGLSNTFLQTAFVSEDELAFTGGFVPPGFWADFTLKIDLPNGFDPFTFTLRQWPTVTLIPEPSTFVLMLAAMAVLAACRWTRRAR
jgi:hypothetical protein